MPGVRTEARSPAAAATDPSGRLLVVDGPGTGTFVVVGARGALVGRDDSSDLVLHSPHVSRAHAVVEEHDGGYAVRDLASTAGTFVNGERVTGLRPLCDGDHLRFADVEVEFHRGGDEPVVAQSRPTAGPARRGLGRLHDEVRQTKGMSAGGLALAVLGSVVATALSSAAGSGQWGTLAAAALGPVVSAVFSTKGARGRGRTVAVAVLTLAALVVTVTGVSLADRAAGRSVLPGGEEHPSTFPAVASDDAARSPGGAEAAVTPATGVDCREAALDTRQPCALLTISSVGDRPVQVTRVATSGDDAADFVAAGCVGRRLDPGQSCRVALTFRPSDAGPRSTAVVVSHAGGDTTVPVVGQGVAAAGGDDRGPVGVVGR